MQATKQNRKATTATAPATAAANTTAAPATTTATATTLLGGLTAAATTAAAPVKAYGSNIGNGYGQGNAPITGKYLTNIANHTINLTAVAAVKLGKCINTLLNAPVPNYKGAALYTQLLASNGLTVQQWANNCAAAGAWGMVGQVTAANLQNPQYFISAPLKAGSITLTAPTQPAA